MDGNRANGCETAGPPTVPGLRVWFDSSNSASLHTVPCSRGNCVARWDNLADAANPAVNVDQFTRPTSIAVRTGGVYFDGTFDGSTFVSDFPANARDHLDVRLAFMVGSAYTTYVVATPITPTPEDNAGNYAIGCATGGPFATNGAFHLGWANRNVTRFGQFNNDLDTNWGQAFTRFTIRASFDFTRQYLNIEDLFGSAGFISQNVRANTAPLNAANNCALGRGPDDFGRFRGMVHEIAIYDRALSSTDSATVENYLRIHWR